MGSCLISVIVPVYNVKDYLDECVRSLLAQSYRELEIILVDDGSTDGSGEMCDGYAASDSRVKVIHKENGGLSSARNAGIDVATGEYLSFVDSDDFIHPEFIGTLYQTCVANDCKTALCGICSEETADATLPESVPVRVISSRELLDAFYGKHHNTITVAWNKLYHRSVLGEVRYPDGFVYEDEATTYAYLYQAGRIAWVELPLYHYRNRTGSITKRAFSLKRLDVLEAYRRRRAFYLVHGEAAYASREEYCYLSELLMFYDRIGKYLPEEKEKRKELLREYKKCHSEYDKRSWGWKRRVFYRISRVLPGLYGKIKKSGR